MFAPISRSSHFLSIELCLGGKFVAVYQAISGEGRRGLRRGLSTRPQQSTKPKKPPATPVASAIARVQELALKYPRNFVETVEISLKLNVDPRKANQVVRGTVSLPHGVGKEVRVAVFARGDDAAAALEAGASVVGAEDLLAIVQAGKLDFDRVIATPELMPIVGRVARILGPRGLMPNPKMGTITKDVAGAVRSAKAGQVEFRAQRDGLIAAGIGKVDFTHTKLMENLRAFMMAISTSKPEGAPKGKYMIQAHLSSSMGKEGIKVDMRTLDPTSGRFMLIAHDEKQSLEQTFSTIESLKTYVPLLSNSGRSEQVVSTNA